MRARHPQRKVEEGLPFDLHLPEQPRGRRRPDVVHFRPLYRERRGVGPGRVTVVEQLADAAHLLEQLPGPYLQLVRPAVEVQRQAGLAPAARDPDVVPVQFLLRRAPDGRALLEHAQRGEGLEEAHLVLVDADGIEHADVERAHLDVLDSRTRQCPGRSLARTRRALWADEAVVLVLDLQHVRAQLPPLAVHLDAQLLVLRARGRDQRRQVAHVLVERVDGHRDVGLALVAIAEVAHAQRRRVGRVERVAVQFLQGRHYVPALEERLAQRRRGAEQVQDQPPVAAVIPQQREIRLVDELLSARPRLPGLVQHRPEVARERVVEVHPRDRLHDPAVTQAQSHAVDALHPSDVGAAVLRDRDAGVPVQRAGHAGRPQQFLVEVPVDELVQVAEVLQQLPGLAEGGRDQLDQRLRVVGRHVRTRQRRAQPRRMRRLGDPSLRRHPQRLLLDPLASALQRAGLARVDQRGQPSLEAAIDAGDCHGRRLVGLGDRILAARRHLGAGHLASPPGTR